MNQRTLHPTRIAIVAALRNGPASSNDIAKATGVTVGAVAYHMRLLRDDGVVRLHKTEQRRGAVESYYRLDRRRARTYPEPLAAVATEAADLLATFASSQWCRDEAADLAFDLSKRLRKSVPTLREATTNGR